jgi:hypothetical protein
MSGRQKARIDTGIAELRSLFHWRPRWDCCHTPEAPTKSARNQCERWRWRKRQGEYGLPTPAAKESPKPRKRKRQNGNPRPTKKRWRAITASTGGWKIVTRVDLSVQPGNVCRVYTCASKEAGKKMNSILSGVRCCFTTAGLALMSPILNAIITGSSTGATGVPL